MRSRSVPQLTVVAYLWLGVTLVAGIAVASLWLTGRTLSVVETRSMSPGLPRNSLAVIGPVNPSTIRVGDVIRFRDPGAGQSEILHRVVRVIHGKTLAFQTQGDANLTPDPVMVPAAHVDGRLGGSVRHLGGAADRLAPPYGTALVGIGPILLLLGWRAAAAWRARSGNPAAVLVS